jgi:hypothetical protein
VTAVISPSAIDRKLNTHVHRKVTERKTPSRIGVPRQPTRRLDLVAIVPV